MKAKCEDIFTMHSDPGHGWLEVTYNDLQSVGLIPVDFSKFSYRKGRRFFLEEDCDAPKFAKAWELKHGRKIREVITDRFYNNDSAIRNYNPIHNC